MNEMCQTWHNTAGIQTLCLINTISWREPRYHWATGTPCASQRRHCSVILYYRQMHIHTDMQHQLLYYVSGTRIDDKYIIHQMAVLQIKLRPLYSELRPLPLDHWCGPQLIYIIHRVVRMAVYISYAQHIWLWGATTDVCSKISINDHDF